MKGGASPRVRFGLCCLFLEEPITFRTTTAKALNALTRPDRLRKISAIVLHNARSLLEALRTCQCLGIGSFRVTSTFFPRYTHPDVGYSVEDLPESLEIRQTLSAVNAFRREHDIRLSLHPDQFVVLNSPDDEVVRRSVEEIEYHAVLAGMIGADVINLHGGGGYGNKKESLKRFARTFSRLSAGARRRLTLENDDVTYTVADLAPLCRERGIPLVYDVHHHRCNGDGLSETEATELAVATWQVRQQEPYFHISSPKGGWRAAKPKAHDDYVEATDVPGAWRRVPAFTLDVEAKAKEKAVCKLMMEWPFGRGSKQKKNATAGA